MDLNCDMGEAYGAWRLGPDAELLRHVTSASIACGFHAGDPRTMDATVRAAVAAGVSVGAHVSYPDLVGFGRRHLQVTGDELLTDVLYQVGALQAFCRRHGTAVRYLKAHGALYNDMATDAVLAAAMGEAVAALGGDLPVLVLAASPAVAVLADAGVRVVQEGFADRAYTAGGALVGRAIPGAVLEDPATVAARALRLATGEPLEAVDGSAVRVPADSVCVHGDTPGAAALAARVRATLAGAGVDARPFI